MIQNSLVGSSKELTAELEVFLALSNEKYVCYTLKWCSMTDFC